MSLFTARNLTKSYRRRKVVNDVTFAVEPGEIVGLLGPNGAGKTTTFYMIVGMIRPNQGRIHLGGEDITTMPLPVAGFTRQDRLSAGWLVPSWPITWPP